MPEKTHADVVLAFLEYRVVYAEPIFDLSRLYAEAARGIFRALRPWNISLENVSHRQNPLNLAEVSTVFGLFNGRVTLNLRLGDSSLLVTNPNWSEAELIIKIATAAKGALEAEAGRAIEKQRASIAMHLKPASGSIKKYVSDLSGLGQSGLGGTDVRAYGISVYGDNSGWVVDASALYPEALFVRVERTLGGRVPLEEIAAQLRADETKILDLLRLEVG